MTRPLGRIPASRSWIDEEIDWAQLGGDPLDQRVNRGGVADVDRAAGSEDALGGKLGNQRLDPGPGPRTDAYAVAGATQRQGGGPADTLGGPGDQGDGGRHGRKANGESGARNRELR